MKLLSVLLMTGFHGAMPANGGGSSWRTATRSPQRFYRIANEVPTVLMVVIVIMVIVKPF